MADDTETVFVPEPVAHITDSGELLEYVQRQFARLHAVMSVGVRVKYYYTPPARPRDGDIVGADGTSWDPGGGIGGPATSGQGVYTFYAGAWHKLG